MDGYEETDSSEGMWSITPSFTVIIGARLSLFGLLCAGPFTFSLHARKTTLKLTAKTAEDADEWIGALQDVRMC